MRRKHMKKKIKSLVVILAALMLFSVVQVFDFVRAKADEMPLIETIPIEDVFS